MRLKRSREDEEFMKKIQAQLDQIPQRDACAISDGKTRFLAQAEMIQRSPVSPETPVRHSKWNNLRIKEVKMGTLASILLIVGLLLGGTSATVYAAQDDLPNEFLYPVKVFSEDVELKMTNDPEQKLNLELKFALRRLDEIEQMNKDGLIPTEPVYARLENQINRSLSQAAMLGEGKMDAALLRIRETLQERSRLLLQETSEPVLTRSRIILEQRLQIVESGIVDPEGFYNEARNGWEGTPNAGEDAGPKNDGATNQNGVGTQNQPTEIPGIESDYQTPGPGYQTPRPGYQSLGPGYQTPEPGSGGGNSGRQNGGKP